MHFKDEMAFLLVLCMSIGIDNAYCSYYFSLMAMCSFIFSLLSSLITKPYNHILFVFLLENHYLETWFRSFSNFVLSVTETGSYFNLERCSKMTWFCTVSPLSSLFIAHLFLNWKKWPKFPFWQSLKMKII